MKITREEAAGLYHAVNWMALCLKDDTDPPQPAEAMAIERGRLAAAKRGLRKVQQIRREFWEVKDTLVGAIYLLDRYHNEIATSHLSPSTGGMDDPAVEADLQGIASVIAGLIDVAGCDPRDPGVQS